MYNKIGEKFDFFGPFLNIRFGEHRTAHVPSSFFFRKIPTIRKRPKFSGHCYRVGSCIAKWSRSCEQRAFFVYSAGIDEIFASVACLTSTRFRYLRCARFPNSSSRTNNRYTHRLLPERKRRARSTKGTTGAADVLVCRNGVAFFRKTTRTERLSDSHFEPSSAKFRFGRSARTFVRRCSVER